MSTGNLPTEKFLSVRDVANRLQLSESLVYRLVEQGKLSCHRLGTGRGVIRFSEADLEGYLVTCRQENRQFTPPRPRRTKLKHLKL